MKIKEFLPTIVQLLKNSFDKLKEEKSVNASAGFTFKPASKLFITLDGYLIKVKDRIVITSQFSDPSFAAYDVESARFFANAVDTETKGVDLVVSYDWALGGGNLNINLLEFNRN